VRPVLWQTYRPGPHLISTRNLIGLGSWAGCRCVSGRGALVVVGSAIAPVTDLAREGIRGIVDIVLQYALVSKSCWTPIVMVGLMHEVVKSDPVTRGGGTTTAFIFFPLNVVLEADCRALSSSRRIEFNRPGSYFSRHRTVSFHEVGGVGRRRRCTNEGGFKDGEF
jgi:hypothetical protein